MRWLCGIFVFGAAIVVAAVSPNPTVGQEAVACTQLENQLDNTKFDYEAGNDKIKLGAGNNRAQGGSGNDVIKGGPGDDLLIGGSGQDKLFGGPGNDLILGDTGSDTLFGNFGADSLYGGPGDDTLNGDNPFQGPPPPGSQPNAATPDTCFGQDGNDDVFNCEVGDPSTPLAPEPPPEELPI